MIRKLWPLLLILPALAVFAYTHWPAPGSSGEGFFTYYLSFVPAKLGVPQNTWDYRVTQCGGWLPFWREWWVSFGALWILAVFAWPSSRPFWKVGFVVLFLGCFAACMVSHDKMRLWFRMGPVLVPIIVEWIARMQKIRLYPGTLTPAEGEGPSYRGVFVDGDFPYWPDDNDPN